MVLISPVMPAAQLACPMLPLIDPSATVGCCGQSGDVEHDCAGVRGTLPVAAAATALVSPVTASTTLALNASLRPLSSIPSPRSVAVAWHSTYVTSMGSTRAWRCASAIARACALALGAVYAAFMLPSLVTAAPEITDHTKSPSASASLRRLSTTAPTESPNTVPEALVSKGRTRPSTLPTRPSPYIYLRTKRHHPHIIMSRDPRGGLTHHGEYTCGEHTGYTDYTVHTPQPHILEVHCARIGATRRHHTAHASAHTRAIRWSYTVRTPTPYRNNTQDKQRSHTQQSASTDPRLGNDTDAAPAIAMSQCPACSAAAACATATSPLEHAELTVIDGPDRFSAYDTRVAM
eukprot:m.346302 g.346302  ORF g.346302 m.346302 type:complete len:348 (-) comp20667_c0_seq4:4200-5243(-)